ncbi:MAG: hypothetical protein ACQESC_01220 [Nanobdellota archaeon]
MVDKKKKSSRVNRESSFEVAPLSQGFFLVSILGLLIAIFFISSISMSWAIIVGIVSGTMFLASMISMTRAPVEDELALDASPSERKERVIVLSKKEYDAFKKKSDNKNK